MKKVLTLYMPFISMSLEGYVKTFSLSSLASPLTTLQTFCCSFFLCQLPHKSVMASDMDDCVLSIRFGRTHVFPLFLGLPDKTN